MYKYSLLELKGIANILANDVTPPFSFFLHGEVGAGKTTFAQFFIKSILTEDCSVTSPTFNIVQIYETSKGPVFHADLYRLKKEEEIFEIGLIEAMRFNICIIEWPKEIKKYIRDNNFLDIFL